MAVSGSIKIRAEKAPAARRCAAPRWLAAAGAASLSLLLAASSLAQGVAPAQTPAAWTLPLLIRYALANNKGLAASRLAVTVVGEDVAIAGGQRLPRLDAVGKYQLFPEHRRLLIERHGKRADNPFQSSILNYGFEATLPLYTGGRIRREISVAKASVAAARSRSQLTRQELIFNVTSAYYAHLRIRDVIAANEALVRAVGESRRIIQEQVNIGRAARIESLRLDARMSEAETQLAVARNAKRKIAATLKALLTLPPAAQLEVVGRLAPANPTMDMDTLKITALALRPDILALESEVEAQKSRIEIAQARRGPTLDASARVGGVSGESNTEIESRFMLSLRIPLYSGGILEARKRQAVSRLGALRARFAAVKRRALAEVERAQIELSSVKTRLDAASRAVALADEAVRVERQRFREGRGTANDLLLAEGSLLRAKTSLASVMADSRVAAAALRLATGELDAPDL